MAEIQNYMEEQEALDKDPGIGMLGTHRVTPIAQESSQVSHLAGRILGR